MSRRTYEPGGDAKVIAEIAKREFGDFTKNVRVPLLA